MEGRLRSEKEGEGGGGGAASGEEEKSLILVQVVRRAVISDFYTVDLSNKGETSSVQKYPGAVLLNEGGLGGTVALELEEDKTIIYALGGFDKISSCLDLRDLDQQQHHIHLGSSVLSGLTARWKPGPQFRTHRCCPDCVTLAGKAYALGGAPVSDSSIGEVFDPSLGRWVDLCPPESLRLDDDNFCLSSPVMVDTNNSRLLVHFRHESSLYAFYPAFNRWVRIDDHFRGWIEGGQGTAVDGVIYFHIPVSGGSRDCVVAYDVSGIPARRLNVVWSSHFSVNIYSAEFEALFYLGNHILCLANYIPLDDDNTTSLQFVRFRAHRHGDDEVLITPLAVNCYPVEGTFRTHTFIPL